VREPANVESVVVSMPNGDGPELWKLNHYYERLDEWEASVGLAPAPDEADATPSEWEVHNLSADPEERHNLADDPSAPVERLRTILSQARDAARRVPTVTNG
jgi:hypothetical protein